MNKLERLTELSKYLDNYNNLDDILSRVIAHSETILEDSYTTIFLEVSDNCDMERLSEVKETLEETFDGFLFVVGNEDVYVGPKIELWDCNK